MSAPLVTVVMTTYNYGHFIEESIESVLSQDYPLDRRELVIVDDGSTDDTADRVRKYGSKIRYFFKPNGGQASALNLGFASARGEIIALLDADDYWLPGKMQRIVAEFQKKPEVGMVYHPFLEFDMETNERRKPYFRPVSGHFFGNKPEFFWYQLPGTSTAFRRKCLEPVFPIPEEIRMLADGYIDALLPLYSPVLAIPEYLAAYRFHGNNCFYADEQQMPAETRKARLQKWQVLIDAIRTALTERGFALDRPPLRPFLERLQLRQNRDQFILQPPGRFRFFRHLLLHNRCYGKRSMESLTVTVLITTYNYAKFIEQAIDSVLSQDYPLERIQIVVVDDGSTDDTSQRVKKYGSSIEYFLKQNGGQASALNFGLAKASGEIVALLDADDMFVPSKLASIAEAFQKNPTIGMVYHQMFEWDVQSNERRALNTPLISGDLRASPQQYLTYFVQPASCTSFRRNTLNSLLPIPDSIRMLADAYLVILVPLVSPILALPEPLTIYRIHGSNSYYADEQRMSQQARTIRGQQILTLIDSLFGWLARNQSVEKQRHVKFFRNRWDLLSKSLKFQNDPPGRWRSFLFLIRQNYVCSFSQSWKFTTLKYLSACSALVLGYRTAQVWEDDILKSTQHLLGKVSRAARTSGGTGPVQ